MPSREVRSQKRAAALGYEGEHFTATEWERLLEACRGRCLRCGATEDLSVDHVVPLSLGGPNTIDNLQVLCEPCNSSKGDSVADYRVAGAIP